VPASRTPSHTSPPGSWRRQSSLHHQLHRVVDRNPHDAGVLVHPAVRAEQLVFLRAELTEILSRVGLQARLRRHPVALAGGKRIRHRRTVRLVRLEILEQREHDERRRHADDDETGAEGQDAAEVHVARLVMDLGVLGCRVRVRRFGHDQ